MHLRKKNEFVGDKENERPELSRIEQNKLNRGIGWSPKHQRRRERLEKNGTTKLDGSLDQSTEPCTREGEIDGFVVTQKLFKMRIGNAFHQLLDNDSRRKDEAHSNDNNYADHHIQIGDNDKNTESRRSSSASGRTSGNGCSMRNGRSPGSRKSSRAGPEKRKHFQDALMELKLRLLGNGRGNNVEGELQQFTHVRSDETPSGQSEERIYSDRVFNERLFLSPQFSIGSMSTWLPRHNKARGTSAEGEAGHNRRSPFRIDHFNKASNGVFGHAAVERSSLVRGKTDALEDRGSAEERFAQRTRPKTRRQQKKRNIQMRRTRSSSSLTPQRGSGFHSNLPDDLIELSVEACLLDQIQELRTSLEKSERVLNDYIEDSKRDRAHISDQVDRLKNLYSSLSQSQDIRYKSLLDVFHENYKLLGYVESNFDYVLSVVARGKRTNLQGLFYGLLRFVARYTMAPILGIVRLGSRIYLRLFPRRPANG